MNVAGFERLGVEDVPGASWVIPAGLTSKALRESISTINKSLLNPMPEGSTEDPRQHLQRRKPGQAREDANQGTLDVNFGSDSEGEDVPDGPLFPPNPRSKFGALDELKKKRKKKMSEAQREPLDDETIEARREARLSNALARQQKIKSDLFIHASDEESDEEADKEFFRLEEERRKAQAENIKNALMTGGRDKATTKGKTASVRKRQGDGVSTTGAESKRRRRGPGSTGSDAGSDGVGDILMAELEGQSQHSQQDVSTNHGGPEGDTPVTSAEDDFAFDDDLAFSRDRQQKPVVPNDDVDEDEEDTPMVSSRRRMRGGFVLDSDSE